MKAEEAAELIRLMQCGAFARESLRSTNLDDEYQRINNEFYGSSLRTSFTGDCAQALDDLHMAFKDVFGKPR